MLSVEPIRAFKDNYIWLLTQDQKDSCAVVDPGDAAPVLRRLNARKLQLKNILITHHHHDHVGGIDTLHQHYTPKIFGPRSEYIPHCTHPLKEGDCVTLSDLELSFTILDIPAHTRGHIAYYGHGLLFCGDTLFTGGCGRLFEGSAEDMYRALQKIATLPDETHIYCAHEYTEANLRFARKVEPHNIDIKQRQQQTQAQQAGNQPTVPSTLGYEKKTNPFLRTHVLAVQKAAEQYAGNSLDTPTSILAALRSWKDRQ